MQWIKNSGNSYINTGIKLNNTSKITIKGKSIEYNENEKYFFIAGARDSIQQRVEIVISRDEGLFVGVFHNFHHTIPLTDIEDMTSVYLSKEVISINGSQNSISDSEIFQMSRSFYLFNDNSPTSSISATLKLTYCKIEQDSSIYEFIPCYRKEDNVAGMYDLVSGEFYTNAGTGEFIVGPDVN